MDTKRQLEALLKLPSVVMINEGELVKLKYQEGEGSISMAALQDSCHPVDVFRMVTRAMERDMMKMFSDQYKVLREIENETYRYRVIPGGFEGIEKWIR